MTDALKVSKRITENYPNAKVKRIGCEMDGEHGERLYLTFLVAGNSSEAAYELANSADLLNEGTRVAREKGLEAPGVNNRGIPAPCDASGKVMGLSDTTDKNNASNTYYCLVIHTFLGDF